MVCDGWMNRYEWTLGRIWLQLAEKNYCRCEDENVLILFYFWDMLRHHKVEASKLRSEGEKLVRSFYICK